MKYLKKINLELKQINLISNNNIKIDNINIVNSGMLISAFKLNDSYYVKNKDGDNIPIKNFNFEEIIFKINDPYLYFSYFQNVLKKPFQDSKGIISDELIEAAISSIESDYMLALQYSELTGKRLRSETEKRFLKKLENKLSDLKSNFLDGDTDIGMSYEIGNSRVYEFIKYFKKSFPEFEKLLLNYSNRNGGLQITGIPYNTEIDDRTDKHYRTILDEVIYNYTITNRGGTWPEIGINNREDLLKLRMQIIGHDTLQFILRGYGELDY